MKSTYWQVAILIVVTGLLYIPFLDNPYVFDDLSFFATENEGQVVSHTFSFLELRSLPYASLSWVGDNIRVLRAENLILHLATSVALLFFIRNLTLGLGKEMGGGKQEEENAAFFAALIFALHPVAVYAAGYLIQRSIVMATLFSLLSMLSYFQGGMTENRKWLWLSVFLYFWAVFSKEHAIMLPFVLVSMTVLMHQDWPTRLIRRAKFFAAMLPIAMFAVAAHKGLIGSIYEPGAPQMLITMENAYPLSVMTQSWLFFKYLWLWVMPNPGWMSVDMREPFAASFFSLYSIAVLAFLIWGGVGGWLLLKRGRQGLVGFAMLFPWLLFMTELSTVRIQENFVLYRSYLWAAGLFCLLPLAIVKFSGGLRLLLVFAISSTLFIASMERLSSFSHPVLLWEDAAKLVDGKDDRPGVVRIHYNFGSDLIWIGDYERAVSELEYAVKLAPNFVWAHGNLGVAYYRQGRWTDAINSFTHAIESARKLEISPPPAKMFFGRALAYENIGESKLAEADYAVSCKYAGKGCEKLRTR